MPAPGSCATERRRRYRDPRRLRKVHLGDRLARLQSVPLELYDAAKVDGAGVIRRFFDVTLPQLKEVLIVVVVFRTIWTFNKFEEIYLLTKGGPDNSTVTIVQLIYQQAFVRQNLGTAAALSLVLLGALLILNLMWFRLLRRGTAVA